VNATYNVSYRLLLEADVTGRGYTPMLQTAVLIASFIVIGPIFVTRFTAIDPQQMTCDEHFIRERTGHLAQNISSTNCDIFFCHMNWFEKEFE
jgi:hypothetical protein